MTISITFALGAGLARISRDTALPRRLTAIYREDKHPEVEVDIVVGDDGVPLCQAIRVNRLADGPSLTGVELGRLPIDEIVDHALRQVATRFASTTASGGTRWVPATSSAEHSRAATRDIRTVRQRRKLTPALLRDVARVYRENAGSAPTKGVASAFSVSAPQASRYVRAAREAGYLDEENA